jgi:hypothetical protein
MADPDLDAGSFLDRFYSLLPYRWWGENAPVRDAVIGGLSDSLEWAYDFYVYAKAQTRISTATEFNLDIIAWDFLGGRLLRRTSQSDDSFRAAVIKEIFRPRATRAAMKQALFDLTGQEPLIFEPANPNDTGCYNINMAWSVHGRYGSLEHPYECWIDIQRPLGQGIPGVEGYGGIGGGWGLMRSEWTSLAMLSGPVTDREIYNTVEAIRAAGTVCWCRISDDVPPADLSSAYSFLADANGWRLMMKDGSGLIVGWPASVVTSPSVAELPKAHLYFDDRKKSALIAAVWPF